MTDSANCGRGRSFPIGATVYPDGINFSIFSKSSTGVELILFENVDDTEPSRTIKLDPYSNRTYHYWHVFVPGLIAGQLYGFRVSGPFQPELGQRFDPGKILLDPYGKCIARPTSYRRSAASIPGDNAASSFRSVAVAPAIYDWEDDTPPCHPFAKTIVYELHIGGFTKHPNSGVDPSKRGTYAGLIEKIPYLKDLGITAIELLPVFAFDENDAPAGKTNYWGYAPVSFFAPHPGYSSHCHPLGAVDEFKDMVKELHRAGIEVILDVVYNHTAEGGEGGPTFCFKGLANKSYYILEQDKSRYANYTGCGNTLNANEPICRRMILDSLRYWAQEMHVDGFRFDLASILTRDENGHPIANPAILWDIESDPVLANVKLIAEAWDAAGLYQVGSFIGDSWKEWNGRFRDEVRAFLKGDEGVVRSLAHRITASPDIYGFEEREPEQSINFMTCHDGFTLNDLVSYNYKHNEANGEDNRDGANHNLSWNCGIEGPTTDPEVERLRNRQVKNFLTLTMLAAGTPMLLMGDEVRRTQRGNNNAYCHDNGLSWFDWDLIASHGDIHRFTKQLIALRQNQYLPVERLHMTLNELLRRISIEWHGINLNCPDWGHQSHALAVTVRPLRGDLILHYMINAYWEPLAFAIPRITSAEPWRICIDTFLDSPNDICDWDAAPVVQGVDYQVQARSVVLLATKPIVQ